MAFRDPYLPMPGSVLVSIYVFSRNLLSFRIGVIVVKLPDLVLSTMPQQSWGLSRFLNLEDMWMVLASRAHEFHDGLSV